MASLASKLVFTGIGTINWLIRLLQTIFKHALPPTESAEYKAWRNQFMWRRLGLCLWGAIPFLCCSAVLDIYRVFYLHRSETFPQELKSLEIVEDVIYGLLIVGLLMFHKSKLGHRYPALLYLCLSLSCTLIPQILGTLSGFVRSSSFSIWILVFLTQATLIPVRWRLHLVSQLSPLVYYVGVNLALGLTPLGNRRLFDEGFFLYIFWFCLICDLGVYLHERLQQSEFESRRELRLFLHAISHDLRTPLMGTGIVLQNLLKKSDSQVTVSKRVLERLHEGNSRQINLINALQEAYTLEARGIELHCDQLQLCIVVNSVLCDLEPLLIQNRVVVKNLVNANLPLINADALQLQRVFNNLISNALKHNPHSVTLTVDAIVKGKKILCRVQDNGVGMSQNQCARVFELYTRGESARFMPGLGLGLYVCRQIITAHGGKIGVRSQPAVGSTFWFTLPIS